MASDTLALNVSVFKLREDTLSPYRYETLVTACDILGIRSLSSTNLVG